jgi:predicted SprT family Zn-dependent metalloprotease
MDIDDQLELEHILFFDRKCRVCGKIKNLMNDFYLTRKDRKVYSSAYSYECKECTKIRILKSREQNKKKQADKWEYPDW